MALSPNQPPGGMRSLEPQPPIPSRDAVRLDYGWDRVSAAGDRRRLVISRWWPWILWEIGPGLPACGLWRQFPHSSTWDANRAVRHSAGILGTFYSSALALLIAGTSDHGGDFSDAGFLRHRSPRCFDHRRTARRDPSVVYGLWGIYVVIPALRRWLTV